MYTEGVMENLPPRVLVLKVSASDPDVGVNGEITYTLHGPDANKFLLEQRTGTMVKISFQNKRCFGADTLLSLSCV